MTEQEFDILDLAQQEELVQRFGTFIKTELVGQHLCDIYSYNNFTVVFYYLCDGHSTILCKCFHDPTGIEYFIYTLYRGRHD